MGENGTLRITTTPTKFDSYGCQDLSLPVAAGGGGEGNNPKEMFVLPIYVFLYFLLLGD
jgi:hypothetical protein